MRYSVSDTAEYGDYVSGPRIIDERIRAEMKQVLTEIQDGSFAKRWIEEGRRGAPEFKRLRAENARAPIEAVGAELRSDMDFIGPKSPPRVGPRGSAEGRVGTGRGRGLMGERIRDLRHDAARRRADAGRSAHRRREGHRRAAAGAAARRRHRGGLPGRLPGEAEAVRASRPRSAPRKTRRPSRRWRRCVPADATVAGAALDPARERQLHAFISTSDIHIDAQAAHDARGGPRADPQPRRAGPSHGRSDHDVEFSAEDASRSEIDFLLEAYEAAIEAGASVINVPDTVGYTEPKEYAAVVKQVVEPGHRPGARSSATHCHNDLGLATANTLAAIQAGARQVEVHRQRAR